MVDVRPFRGLRFGPRAGAELSPLLASPYDVITPEEQEALHQNSPYNIVRLELGKVGPGDTSANNRYTRAKALLSAWSRDAILMQESQPAFYLCRHTFQHLVGEHTRWELLAQIRLAEWEEGVVLPHERTLPEPKVDRLSLLRALTVNTSPIWAMYRDPSDSLRALYQGQALAAPAAAVPLWRDASFTLWAITDPQAIQRVGQILAGSPLYVADGHHRYETALAYRREQREAHPGCTGEEGFNYVFMSLTGLEDPGLLILPIHRLVKGVPPERLAVLRQELSGEWEIDPRPVRTSTLEQEVRQALAQGSADTPCFGLYGLEPGKLLYFRPRVISALRSRLPANASEAVRGLDVTLLHEVILHGYLAIGREAQNVEAALGFTHDAQEAIELVDAGAYQLAFLVNPTRVDQVVAVAEAGDKMPQKSTFFYPKLPVGLVLSPLEDFSSL